MNPPLPTSGLQQGVQFLKGVGPARADVLAKLGITTIADLIFHFPRHYDDLTDVRAMDNLSAGELQTIHGEIVEMESKERPDGRQVLSIVIADPRGKCVEGVWYGQFYLLAKYRYGQKVAYSGKPKWHRDHWQMNHPRVEALADTPATAVVPVYPLTETLAADRLREMIRQALTSHAAEVIDIMPAAVRGRAPIPRRERRRPLASPFSGERVAQGLAARRRFIYEEFLVLQVASCHCGDASCATAAAPCCRVDQQIDEPHP